MAVSCTGGRRSTPLLLDLSNSICVVHGVERDALGTAASAREWMRQRCIVPTYGEWMSLVEARSELQNDRRCDTE
jgi:hypothetical protein